MVYKNSPTRVQYPQLTWLLSKDLWLYHTAQCVTHTMQLYKPLLVAALLWSICSVSIMSWIYQAFDLFDLFVSWPLLFLTPPIPCYSCYLVTCLLITLPLTVHILLILPGIAFFFVLFFLPLSASSSALLFEFGDYNGYKWLYNKSHSSGMFCPFIKIIGSVRFSCLKVKYDMIECDFLNK